MGLGRPAGRSGDRFRGVGIFVATGYPYGARPVLGAFMFADGVSAGITGWHLYKRGVRRWPYRLLAVIGGLAGALAFLWPGLTAVGLMFVIAFWALFGGVSQVIAAVRLRKEIQGEWFLIAAGAVSVLFGLLLIFRPVPEGMVAISWMIGIYAMIVGALYVMLALKLRRNYVKE